MLHEGLPQRTVYDRLAHVLEGVHAVVAHNIRFHLGVLTHAMQSVQADVPLDRLMSKPTLCTMELGRQLEFKVRSDGQALYPRLDELFGYLYFERMHLTLCYSSKTLRDVRLVASCLRSIIARGLIR